MGVSMIPFFVIKQGFFLADFEMYIYVYFVFIKNFIIGMDTVRKIRFQDEKI